MPDSNIRIVKEPERALMTGYSRAQWWRLEKANLVPKRIKLGRHSVGWFKHEVEAWLEERAAEREVQ